MLFFNWNGIHLYFYDFTKFKWAWGVILLSVHLLMMVSLLSLVLFCQPYLDQEQSSHLGGTNRRGPNMINKIRDAINFMRNQRLEVGDICDLNRCWPSAWWGNFLIHLCLILFEFVYSCVPFLLNRAILSLWLLSQSMGRSSSFKDCFLVRPFFWFIHTPN